MSYYYENKRSNYIIYLGILIFFTSCKPFEHINPLDPEYDGEIKRQIKIHSSSIYDPLNLGGNEDSKINRGEKLKVYIQMINLGNSLESNVQAAPKILSNNFVKITDYFLHYDNMLPNQISIGGELNYKDNIAQAFVELEIDKSITPNTSFAIELEYFDMKDTLYLICEEIGAKIIVDNIIIENASSDINRYYFNIQYILKNIGSRVLQ